MLLSSEYRNFESLGDDGGAGGTTVSCEPLQRECEGRSFQSPFYVWKSLRNFYFLPYSSADTRDENEGELGLPRAKGQKQNKPPKL